MSKVFDVPADLLITHVAADLKDKQHVQAPAWTAYVKTGAHKERAPQDPDWFYLRLASILRRVYIDGPVGTESLRTYYGHRKARGGKPHEFRKAGGKVIRLSLQILEKLGFIEKDKNKDGRRISGNGEKYLHAHALFVAEHAEKMRKAIQDKKRENELARAKKYAVSPKDEKKEMKKERDKDKKKKGEEEEDPTATKMKRKNK